MEVNITKFFNEESPRDYSASVAELGNDAGALTWNYANEQAADAPLLTTPEQLENVRAYFEGFGAWEREEIDAWSATELNALLVQDISGNMRDYCDDVTEWDWEEYQQLSEAGQVGGCIYKGDDGQIYAYIGL